MYSFGESSFHLRNKLFSPQNLKLPEDQKCVGNRLSAARLLGLGSSQSFCTMFLRLDPTVQSRYSEISRRDYLSFLTSDRKMSRAALEAKNLSMGLKKTRFSNLAHFDVLQLSVKKNERLATFLGFQLLPFHALFRAGSCTCCLVVL